MLVFLAACADPEVGLGDKPVEEPLPDLGDPFVAIVASVAEGTFKSTCIVRVDLMEDGAVTATAQVGATGGEWAGVTLEGGVQYTALATWTDCTNGETGTGSFTSSTFSGVEGDFFVFRYSGVTAAFETLVQREDFDGAEANVRFEEGTSAADVGVVAERWGVEADLVTEGSTEYRLSWSDAMAVGEVLSAFSTEDAYAFGEPGWIVRPEWW